MSLRFRLFLILGALVAALVGAHGWLVRSLAGELATELDVVALDVGASVAQALAAAPDPAAVDGHPAPDRHSKVKIIHLTERQAGQPPDLRLSSCEPGPEANGGKVFERVLVRPASSADLGSGAN